MKLQWAVGFLVVAIIASLLLSRAMGNRRIRIQAPIVDSETGQPLLGVRTIITERRASLFVRDFVTTSDFRREVDGTFGHTCASCLSVKVLFMADGYYSETHTYRADGNPMRGKGLKDDVVMAKHGEYVTLYEYKGRVVAADSLAETSVLPIGDLPGPTIRNHRLYERAAKSTESPTTYLQLSVSTSGDGAIITQPHPRVRTSEIPLSALLEFSTTDSGFIPYLAIHTQAHKIYREMRLAPVSGYQTRLELKAEQDSWFYAKIGDRYGLGRATAPVVIKTQSGERRVEVSVILHVNPDGSTNLNGSQLNP